MEHINWYPGHMAKTKRLISENLKSVDIVLEVIDARIVKSSKNNDIDEIICNKKRLILINKSDIADPAVTKKWLEYYENQGIPALSIQSNKSGGGAPIFHKVKSILSELLKQRENKSIVGKSIKMMVLGVPNVGKSSLINMLAGIKRAKVEDRPGVTRGKQWITLENGFDLLDMPGILQPKLDGEFQGFNLSATGAIKDTILDTDFIAASLAVFLKNEYKDLLCNRYKLADVNTDNGYEILEMIGKKRGFIISGGEIDIDRTSKIFLDEFRSGIIGRISLEK